MRGTVVCLAVISGFLGTAGPSACLCAASVPARDSVSFASMDPMRNAPGWGAGQAANSPVCSAKSCNSMEQIYEQAQHGDAESRGGEHRADLAGAHDLVGHGDLVAE